MAVLQIDEINERDQDGSDQSSMGLFVLYAKTSLK